MEESILNGPRPPQLPYWYGALVNVYFLVKISLTEQKRLTYFHDLFHKPSSTFLALRSRDKGVLPPPPPADRFRTADSGARGYVPLAFHTFLNTLNELIILLFVNRTLLSLHCAIKRP